MSLPSDNAMDPVNSFLGKELLEEITPVVMVLTTSLAEDACQKNGFNFIEMLHPFSVFNRIDVPVRTASDQPYRLQMFKLRLVYSSDLHQQTYEDAEEKLRKVVGDASEIVSDVHYDPPELESKFTQSESEYCPSWIQSFNKELIRTLSFSEHEAFDHPVACLLVVSSKEDRPINKFIDLFNTDRLPSLLNDGVMDPKILKHYLLLHDNQDGTLEKATNILAEMRSTFGLYGCKLLCINSAQDVGDGLGENPWIHNKTNSLPGQDLGGCLNVDDLNGIKDFMQDLASKHIIPSMEQKIRILNQQVSATRKGFRNQIKNLWWRKGKEDTPEAPNGPTYTFSSIESQIRVLADYAFMLRDYELALSNYRLLSTDYKLDKSWKRYAGVQEMMGLAFFMLDQSRKEAEYCMETAFTTYMRLGSLGQRNATRCGLWWAGMLKSRGQYKDAAGIYFRIASEEPSLHAAVMLEQASYCYLFSRPPMLRKYGFHLVLSGNRYYISDQKPHAIRMYRNALSVYEGHAWKYICDHVHFNVGRWYAFLGISDIAIKHMLEVLACSHQSLATQDLFLGEFFQTVERTGKNFEVNKLQLPVIDMSSYKVIYEDHRTYASSGDANVKESLWQSLEEDMVPSTYTVRSNWLESQPKFSPLKKYNESHVSVVGEAIKLDVEIKNPLHLSISVSGISLICDLCASPEATELDISLPATSFQEGELKEPPSCRDLNIGDASMILPEFDLILGGGETKRVQLSVTPKVEGLLKILGIRWKLSGLVGGYQYFEFDTKRKQKRGKKGLKHSSRDDLNFIVIKGLPKLEGCIRNLPKKAFADDLRLLILELRNQSEHSLKNIKMKISHSRFLIPGSVEDLNKDFPSCLEAHISSDRKNIQPNGMEKSENLLFSFPSDTTIDGGTTFAWPLWLHTALCGNISLYISIYYEMESCSSDMIYRVLRMHYDVEVLPSLDVSFVITPCPLRLQDFIVRMDIVNRTSSESFSLQQLSCVGDQWEITSLPTYDFICLSQVLVAGQALSCFFKLKDCRTISDGEGELTVQGSDLLLCSQGSSKTIVDISNSPLAKFHQRERHNQGNSVEGSRGSVDFILISKVQGDYFNPDLGPPSKLLCGHICHCSISSKSPILWLVDGPRTISHDFSSSFCEVTLGMKIHNRSKAFVSVKITTFDGIPSDIFQVLDKAENEGGWQDVPLVNELKSISHVQRLQPIKPKSQSICPFVWCASSSTQLKLEPESSKEVPLRICVFSPGTFDLSNYEMHWKLHQIDGDLTDDVKRTSSGMSRGHPFYLTALQSALVALE